MDDLHIITKAFAVRAIRFVESLSRSQTSQIIGKQFLRSATSVGANYRAACRARSTADFIAKMGIVEEESDESMYWLELLVEADILPQAQIEDLKREADRIVAMTVKSIKTARSNNQ